MTARSKKRKRGAPVGNQNARKHGFYSRVLTPDQETELPVAANVEGLDGEIALTRVKIASILRNDSHNYQVLLLAISLLARLLRTRHLLQNHVRGKSADATGTIEQFLSRLMPPCP